MKDCETYLRIGPDGTDCQNIEIQPYGGCNPVHYRTLRGFVSMLMSQNAVCKKHGIKARFEIVLPIKG